MQFRVSNRDVAFHYLLERQGKDGDTKRTRVLRELSAFNPVGGTKTFLCPQIGPETGWEQTKPSYEERYLLDQEMNVRSQFGLGYTFPCLFRVPSSSNDSRSARPEGALSKQSGERTNNNYWMLISETGVTSQYCGSHLSDYTAGEGYFQSKAEKEKITTTGCLSARLASLVSIVVRT